MIIEDPESFKAWLTTRLEPLCDADPAALAKYVYALVKKDKPVEELRSGMIGQLEVFLQKETQGFVNLLFKTLETQRYDLNEAPPAPPAPAPAPPKNAGTTEFEIRDPSFTVPPSNEEPEKKTTKEPSAAILASAQNSTSLGCALLATATGRKDFDRHGRKCDSDKEERVVRRRGRRGSSASPERGRRSRSRSFERRRSRSRDRDRGRAWRNKSPPSRGRYDRDRRHTHSKSPVSRRYSKSRSPPNRDRRTRYRNRSPPRSRSRSRTPISNKYPNDLRDRKDSALGISPRDPAHGDTDLRMPALSQNIQSVVSLPAEQPAAYQGARRCRDFDEKGYCMRGDLCPYDHGSDPVILEDMDPLYNGTAPTPLMMTTQPPPPITAPPPPITQVPTNNMAEYNPDAPSMEPRMWSRPQFRSGGPMMRGMVRNSIGRGYNHQRELINVVTGTPHFRHTRPPMNQEFTNNNHNTRAAAQDKQNFDYGRLGPNRMQTRPPIPQHTGGNTSIQLKKVPSGVNDITLLNNHFSKFGKIVNIQVNFEGDPESALITFATHTEANVAYKSTEAVLNNRFIRVFWYNPSNNNENKPKTPSTQAVTTKPSVLERLGAPPPKVLHNIQPSAVQHEEKVTVVNNNITKTLYIPSAMKKEAVVPTQPQPPLVTNNIVKEVPNENLLKKIEEVTIAKKKQEEARKAGIKLNADLRKRKQELLEKQINQQKILIQRVEAGNVPEQTKASLMATIKELQGSIEKIRKDLENSVKANLTTASKKVLLTKEQQALYRKTKEEIVESRGEETITEDAAHQTQKELLDAELDLLQSQHEGKDVSQLRMKVIELKKKAAAFGVPSTRGAYRGRLALSLRARGRGRGRGSRFLMNPLSAFDPHNVVDHRPTKILVSGYEQDDKDEVIKHFEVFGEILDYISDDATPSLVLNYKSRKDAEKSILKGRNFHDRLLSVTWATPNTSIRGGIPTKPPPTPSHRQVTVLEDEENIDEVIEDAEDEDEIGILSPDILIHEDEDEDEEERSWRR